MKKIKKFLMYFLLVIVVLVLVAIFPALFYKKSVNDTPLPPYYKKGAYHMHSVFSDGKGTIEEITAAGASVDSGLDFLILTDHGEPNRKSSNATAYKNNVLLIGGSEFSLNCGHLAAVGYKLPDYIFPPEPQEAIDEVTGDGGVCFISHPFDDHIPWSDWDVNGFTGLEVLSSYSAARKISFLRLLAFPFQYTVDSKYALTGALNFPHENLEKWHALNLNSRFSYYGIYALDTHAKLPITSNFQLNFPTYQSMFEILTVYVNVDKVQDKDPIHAKASIISALRKGRFFNVIESIAAANGFEAYFTEPTGNRVEMGGFSGSANGKLSILTPFPFDTDVVIKKDGKLFKRFAGNKKDRLEIVISDSGSYIIEVYVPDNTFSELPWILSNPFFIG
ncbi:MAG: hypothetical protein GY757_31820, partial [bacterium]|nr:hypothetical protein [bacterium]